LASHAACIALPGAVNVCLQHTKRLGLLSKLSQ
jgi:hypothetical protein